jgi:hypothetical protein
LQYWHAVKDALIGCRPSDRLRSLIDRAIVIASFEHRAAERRLYDVFDLITTDLLEAGDKLNLEQHRARLLARARYHEKTAAAVEDRDHADMHRRIAEQLRETEALIETKPAAPPQRRARL